jgi:phosphoesterase RecJ-like protein
MKNRRFYSIFLIVSLISSLFLSVSAAAQEPFELQAEAGILVEAATGEILYEIALYLLETGKIPHLPPRVINGCYAAICSDTGCFRYANTTPRALRTAAELLEAGADRDRINRCLFESKSEAQLRAEGEAARRLLLHDGGKIASVTFPYSLKQELGIATEDMETVIDIPRSVAGVEVAFSVRQPEDRPFFRVSMRSSSEVDVAAICAKFGGGGHKRAAGCGLEAANVREAEEKILLAIRGALGEEKFSFGD